MPPPHVTLDLGLRQGFHMGKFPTNFRFTLSNVFDEAASKVVAVSTLMMDDRRRVFLTLSADF